MVNNQVNEEVTSVVEPDNKSLVTQAETEVDKSNNIPIKEKVDVETLIPKDDYRTDPTFYAIADYFNIPPEEYEKSKDYLSEIVDFVIRDSGTDDRTTILAKIRELEDKVQPPQWGEKRYWNIRKYVRLAAKRSDIDKAMGAFVKQEKTNE